MPDESNDSPSPPTAPTSGEQCSPNAVAELLSNLELYCTPDGTPYARLTARESSTEMVTDEASAALLSDAIPVRSNVFAEAINALYFSLYTRPAKPSLVKAVCRIAAWEARRKVQVVDDPDDLFMHVLLKRLEDKNCLDILTQDLLSDLNTDCFHHYYWHPSREFMPTSAIALGKQLRSRAENLRVAGWVHTTTHSRNGTMNHFKEIENSDGSKLAVDSDEEEDFETLLGSQQPPVSVTGDK